jgi:hypothetical protein
MQRAAAHRVWATAAAIGVFVAVVPLVFVAGAFVFLRPSFVTQDRGAFCGTSNVAIDYPGGWAYLLWLSASFASAFFSARFCCRSLRARHCARVGAQS